MCNKKECGNGSGNTGPSSCDQPPGVGFPPVESTDITEGRRALGRFLEHLIRAEEANANRPGWTPWAIYGALASLAWLLTGILQNHTVHWKQISFTFLTLSLICDVLYVCLPAGSRPNGMHAETGRFDRANHLMGASRTFALLLLARAVLLLVLTHHLKFDLPPLLYAASMALLAVEAALLCGAVAMSFTSEFIPVRGEKSTIVVGILAIVIMASIAGSFAKIAVARHADVSIADVRAALICFAGSILLVLLVRAQRPSPLIHHIHDLYRRFSIGQIGVDDAAKEVDELILGLRLEAVLQPRVARVLESFNRIRELTQRVASCFRALDSMLPREGGDVKPENRAAAAELVRSATQLLKELEAALDEPGAPIEGLKKDMIRLCRADKSAASQAHAVWSRLEQEAKRLKAEYAGVSSVYAGLKERLEGARLQM